MSSTLLSRPEVTVLGPPDTATRKAGSRLRDHGYFSEALEGTPWRIGDVVRLAGRQALGLMGLVVAWVGCSGSVIFRTQVGWIAGAVLALVVAATGGVAWVLSGLGAVGRERRLVRMQIRELYLSDAAASGEVATGSGFVAGDGMLRYHRPDCDVVKGKPVFAVKPADLQPCGMCQS